MAKQESKSQKHKTKVKKKKVVASALAVAHIKASFNNTIVTFTDLSGNVICWKSAGGCNFRGSRKSSGFAATLVGQECAKLAKAAGVKEVEVRIKGAGQGRESAIRGVATSGIIVSSISDDTPIPHNGCRPRKRRRV